MKFFTGRPSTDSCCIASSTKSSPSKSDLDEDFLHMKTWFGKLKELVPTTRSQDGQMDITELLQNVIDYIYDLQDELEVSASGWCGVLKSRQRPAPPPIAGESEVSVRTEGEVFTIPTVTSALTRLDRPPSQ